VGGQLFPRNVNITSVDGQPAMNPLSLAAHLPTFMVSDLPYVLDRVLRGAMFLLEDILKRIEGG